MTTFRCYLLLSLERPDPHPNSFCDPALLPKLIGGWLGFAVKKDGKPELFNANFFGTSGSENQTQVKHTGLAYADPPTVETYQMTLPLGTTMEQATRRFVDAYRFRPSVILQVPDEACKPYPIMVYDTRLNQVCNYKRYGSLEVTEMLIYKYLIPWHNFTQWKAYDSAYAMVVPLDPEWMIDAAKIYKISATGRIGGYLKFRAMQKLGLVTVDTNNSVSTDIFQKLPALCKQYEPPRLYGAELKPSFPSSLIAVDIDGRVQPTTASKPPHEIRIINYEHNHLSLWLGYLYDQDESNPVDVIKIMTESLAANKITENSLRLLKGIFNHPIISANAELTDAGELDPRIRELWDGRKNR